MKRFIRYLYEYESEKRIRNVGFIKVEAGYEETIVHIQAKGFHSSDERKLVLYLFYEESGEYIRIFHEEKNLTSPVLNWNCTFGGDDVGGSENYSKICGILLETGNGRKLAATWEEISLNVNNLKELNVCVQEESESGEKESKELTVQMEDDVQQEKFQKITRQDISKLPRCEWKLANNQFLIYGYNNYHHLLLIDDGNNLKLGVPGIYHIKEEKCADAFGFGEFLAASDLGLEPMEEELFGYWCRNVKRQRNQYKIKETDSGDDYR